VKDPVVRSPATLAASEVLSADDVAAYRADVARLEAALSGPRFSPAATSSSRDSPASGRRIS
jgi:hypothetical protein